MRSLGWVLSLLASAVIGTGLPVCCLAEMDCCASAVTGECQADCCDECAAPREGIGRQAPAPHGLGCTCADLSLAQLGQVHGDSGAAVASPAIAPAFASGLELPPPAVATTVRPERCAPPRAPGDLRLPLLL